MPVGDSSVTEDRLSVHAHTKLNIHREYASVYGFVLKDRGLAESKTHVHARDVCV